MAYLLKIFTGDMPFNDLTSHQAMQAIIDGRHPTRSSSYRPIPDFLWTTMEECWRSEPQARIKTPELATQLLVYRRYASDNNAPHVPKALSTIYRSIMAQNTLLMQFIHLTDLLSVFNSSFAFFIFFFVSTLFVFFYL